METKNEKFSHLQYFGPNRWLFVELKNSSDIIWVWRNLEENKKMKGILFFFCIKKHIQIYIRKFSQIQPLPFKF